MRLGLATLVLGAIVACASSSEDAASGGNRGPTPGNNSGAGTGGSSGPGISDDAGVPPETEKEASFQAPVVSGRFIWSANPLTGRVALIDARSRTIRTTEAGFGPTFLAAIPSALGNRAIVINTLSHDATLLSASDAGEPSATGKVPVHARANSWSVSKAGNFAIAWTNADTEKDADTTAGFQDITVVDLRTQARSTRLSVGFRPSRVFIDAAEARAFVVCEPGITVVNLAEARVERDIAVSDNPARDAKSFDVSVLPDGKHAIVRTEASESEAAAKNVTLVDLESGARSKVELSGVITDLDLASDSTMAVAVIRGTGSTQGNAGAGGNGGGSAGSAGGGAAGESGAAGEAGSAGEAGGSTTGGASGASGEGGTTSGPVLPPQSSAVLLPIPGIFTAPGVFETVSIDEVFGSVALAPAGARAALYTNAVASSHVTLLNTDKSSPTYAQYRTVDVKGNVDTLFVSPNGEHAVVGFKADPKTGKSGFAVLPLGARLPARVQTTEARVFAVALANTRAVVTVNDGKQNFATYIVKLPELTVDRIVLPSEPLEAATGVVPDANVAYVAQLHPEGRITLIDLTSGAPQTITGFELAARVQNGQ